jgi:single stranded DNA-binding protein
MSADFATMQVNGRMTNEPKVFEVGATNKAVFSVAVNRRFKTKGSDQWEKRTTFIDCVAWGTNAKHVQEHGKKGAKVSVTGNWETDRYTNGKGEDVKRSHLNVNNISIFTVRGDDVSSEPVEENEEVPL